MFHVEQVPNWIIEIGTYREPDWRNNRKHAEDRVKKGGGRGVIKNLMLRNTKRPRVNSL